jgi:hypothetical protein
MASFALIVAVLALHFHLRWQAADRRPLAALLGLYPHSYSRSLSVLADRGLVRLPLGKDAASEEVRRFLDMEVDALPEAKFTAYLNSLSMANEGWFGGSRYVDLSRVGDLYTAALVWKACGISWSALDHFYVLVSTASCFVMLLIGWRMSGQLLAGLGAALLFAISPFESGQVLRDANPLWFLPLAFLAFSVLRRQAGTKACAAGCLALGAATTAGYGWRPDCLVWLPFFLCAGALAVWLRGRNLQRVALTACCYVIGAIAVIAMYKAAIEPAPHSVCGNSFHIGYFGEEVRADLTGAENSLQVGRDDAKVASDAFAYFDSHPSVPVPRLYDSGYGKLCQSMYRAAIKYNLHHWVRDMPHVAWYALGGCSIAPQVQGVDCSTALSPGALWLGERWLPLLRCWPLIMPALFFIGSLAVCMPSFDRGTVSALLAFCGYYIPIWFLITPELRHWGVLLVPLCIIGGLAPSVLLRLASSVAQGEWQSAWRAGRLAKAVLICAAVPVIWLFACWISQAISAHERASYLNDVLARRDHATDAGDRLRSNELFIAQVPQGREPLRRGYLLEIETAANPGELTCQHVRLAKKQLDAFLVWAGTDSHSAPLDFVRRVIWWNSFLETRHHLHANRKQMFFVTCMRSSSGGDTRSYALRVAVGGDARITAAREMDLADWDRLQMSTVFLADAPNGTTPYVGGLTTRTFNQFPATREVLTNFGFPEIKLPVDP